MKKFLPSKTHKSLSKLHGLSSHSILIDKQYLAYLFHNQMTTRYDMYHNPNINILSLCFSYVSISENTFISIKNKENLLDKFSLFSYNTFSISFSKSCGFVVGAKRSTTLPLRSTKNLVKFHLIAFPSIPEASFFKYWYKG